MKWNLEDLVVSIHRGPMAVLSQGLGGEAGRSLLRAACFLLIQLLLAEALETQAEGPGRPVCLSLILTVAVSSHS